MNDEHEGKRRLPPQRGGGKRRHRDKRWEARREAAEARQAARAARTGREQLEYLNKAGHAAAKERARIYAELGREAAR